MSCSLQKSASPYQSLWPEPAQAPREEKQLNLSTLMPASWNQQSLGPQQSLGLGQGHQQSQGDHNDWSRYSVSRAGAKRYISASGASRFRQSNRSSLGRKIGEPNLLRTQPPTALGAARGDVIFNDSGFRQALVDPAMRSWVGSGQ